MDFFSTSVDISKKQKLCICLRISDFGYIDYSLTLQDSFKNLKLCSFSYNNPIERLKKLLVI